MGNFKFLALVVSTMEVVDRRTDKGTDPYNFSSITSHFVFKLKWTRLLFLKVVLV